MYTLSLQRRFEAWHHLIGGDWGAENQRHSHPYRLELRLEGEKLDKNGYLVDLVQVEGRLDELLHHFRGADLNELAEFAGLNPSLEHFARILANALAKRLENWHLRALRVQLWENEDAWASYRLEF